jgi:hypothetical protein
MIEEYFLAFKLYLLGIVELKLHRLAQRLSLWSTRIQMLSWRLYCHIQSYDKGIQFSSAPNSIKLSAKKSLKSPKVATKYNKRKNK